MSRLPRLSGPLVLIINTPILMVPLQYPATAIPVIAAPVPSGEMPANEAVALLQSLAGSNDGAQHLRRHSPTTTAMLVSPSLFPELLPATVPRTHAMSAARIQSSASLGCSSWCPCRKLLFSPQFDNTQRQRCYTLSLFERSDAAGSSPGCVTLISRSSRSSPTRTPHTHAPPRQSDFRPRCRFSRMWQMRLLMPPGPGKKRLRPQDDLGL